jgi:hypothetical protein
MQTKDTASDTPHTLNLHVIIPVNLGWGMKAMKHEANEETHQSSIVIGSVRSSDCDAVIMCDYGWMDG